MSDTPQTLIARILADVTALAAQWPTPPMSVTYPRAVTDRQVRTKPPLPLLGPANTALIDPAYNTKILRVTDFKTFGGTSFRTPSIGRGWSGDSKMFVLETTGGAAFTFEFDAAGFRADLVAQAPTQNAPSFGTIGRLAYGGVSRGVPGGYAPVCVAYDPSTKAVTDLIDVTSLVSGVNLLEPRTYARDIAVQNNVLLALFGGQSQDGDHYVVWAPLTPDGKAVSGTRKLLDTQNDPRLPKTNLHAATHDQSGRYVWLSPTAADLSRDRTICPAYLWDTTLGTITALTTENGGHGAVGFASNVNAPDDNDGSQVLYRSYDRPDVVRELITPYATPSAFQESNHLSWWNAQPDRLMPVLIANYRYFGANPTPWRTWDDEVVAVETREGPSVVYRFCHHRSNIAHDTDPANKAGYWYFPRPQVSPDGKWCLFTSNWEKTLGPDAGAAPWEGNSFRQDTFLVALM